MLTNHRYLIKLYKNAHEIVPLSILKLFDDVILLATFTFGKIAVNFIVQIYLIIKRYLMNNLLVFV